MKNILKNWIQEVDNFRDAQLAYELGIYLEKNQDITIDDILNNETLSSSIFYILVNSKSNLDLKNKIKDQYKWIESDFISGQILYFNPALNQEKYKLKVWKTNINNLPHAKNKIENKEEKNEEKIEEKKMNEDLCASTSLSEYRGNICEANIHEMSEANIHEMSEANIHEMKLSIIMIVKNESKIIRRCLESVLPIIQFAAICDTGSTDNTVEIIEEIFNEYQKPVIIMHHKWKNFGHNRTLSFQLGKKFAQYLNYDLKKTYCLAIDADHTIKWSPNFHESFSKQNAGAYKIKLKNAILLYDNNRFLRFSEDWKSISPTHEYWDAPDVQAVPFHDLWIEDKEDGGAKADKFTRDIKLLEQGLVEEPNNVRYMFYLAQSYESVGNLNKAIEFYKKRIKAGGWWEEIYISYLRIGRHYFVQAEQEKEPFERKEKFTLGISYLLQAYEVDPGRLEAIYEIIHYYCQKNGGSRNLHSNIIASMFIDQALDIHHLPDRSLFLEKTIYEYKILLEHIINYFYCPTKRYHQINMVCNKLITELSIPLHERYQVMSNEVWYMPKINAQYYKIEVETPFINDFSYKRLNPSLTWHQGQLYINCRTVNYEIRDNGTYNIHDPQNKVRTENIILKNCTLKDDKVCFEEKYLLQTPNSNEELHILGLEDLRIFSNHDKLQFLTTSYHFHPDIYGPQQFLGSFLEKNFTKIENLIYLPSPNKNQCEKNWIPITIENNYLISYYNSDPFTILKINLLNGEYEPIIKHSKFIMKDFRGSGGSIDYKDGYLILFHTVVELQPGKRTYKHQFVHLDNNFTPQRISNSFFFLEKGVEYAAGLTYDQTKENILIGYGFKDSEAYIIKISLEEVENSFK